MIVIWSRLEGKKVCNCTRCASCVRRLMFRIILCITQLIALWYPLVYLKISAPLIPMCPLSLRPHTKPIFFLRLSSLINVFGCCCCFIVRCCGYSGTEQSRAKRGRERDHHVQPWSFANRSSILLSDPCTLRCGGMIEISFFSSLSTLFSSFLIRCTFLRDKHET